MNTSEIEFLIQNEYGNIIPIEIKSRINPKTKSLRIFLEKYPHIKEFAIFSLSLEDRERQHPLTSIEHLIHKWKLKTSSIGVSPR